MGRRCPMRINNRIPRFSPAGWPWERRTPDPSNFPGFGCMEIKLDNGACQEPVKRKNSITFPKGIANPVELCHFFQWKGQKDCEKHTNLERPSIFEYLHAIFGCLYIREGRRRRPEALRARRGGQTTAPKSRSQNGFPFGDRSQKGKYMRRKGENIP